MKRKVVLAGGTGFIGRYLEKQFRDRGDDVVLISRDERHIPWGSRERIVEALENADLLINLAGRSVDCRYSEKNKQEILRSRTETTAALGNALLRCVNPPSLWINSSTATIYRHAEDRPMTENAGEIGSGFSVEVAKAWEGAFFAFNPPRTRQAALRIAIVLGPGGGVMKPLRNLVRFGLGGAQGPGNQMFSWIHLEDLYRIILFIRENEELSGVFNGSSPNPVTNRELMARLRQAMGVSVGLPSPKWLLELGAVLIRTETELVLKSRWVVPDRLEKAGFRFQYAHLDEALRSILRNR